MKLMVVQYVKKSPKYQFLSRFFALILDTSQVDTRMLLSLTHEVSLDPLAQVCQLKPRESLWNWQDQ